MDNLSKYMNFGFVPENSIAKRVMDKARSLIIQRKWDINELSEDRRRLSPDSKNTKAKAFFINYHGEKLFAVFLFIKYEKHSGQNTVFIFSNNYFFSTRSLPISSLFGLDIEFDQSVYNCLCRYHEDHQRAGLLPYLENYKESRSDTYMKPSLSYNFIIPLIAQYHTGMEKLVKAGMLHLLQYLLLCDVKEEYSYGRIGKTIQKTRSLLMQDQKTYSNFREWFGISNKLLFLLNDMLEDLEPYEQYRKGGWWYVIGTSRNRRGCLSDTEFFARISDVYHYFPNYLNVPKMTPSLLRFIVENHLLKGRNRSIIYNVNRGIVGVSRMTNKQILTILQYTYTLNEHKAELYFQYLNYMGKAGFKPGKYIHGLKPKNILAAYSESRAIYEGYYSNPMFKRFNSTVNTEEYRAFQSSDSDSGFVVCVPESPIDLLLESERMGNCVKDYWEDVANSETYILFLRKKEEPDKSYVTMEISKDRKLLQFKSRENNYASIEAQKFIKKYCDERGIQIMTYDIRF